MPTDANTANPMGASDLGGLGDAFGAVESKPTTKASQKAAAQGEAKPEPKAKAEPDTPDDDHDEEPDSRTPRDTGDPEDDNDEGEEGEEGEGEEDDEEGEPTKAATFELKVNGEVRQLTLAQMQEAASKGFSSNERWEKASARQKEADAAIGQVNAQRAQLGNMLNVLHTQTRAILQGETPANLDELAITDPAGYVRAKHALDRRLAQLRDIEAAHAYLVSQQREQDEHQRGVFLDTQRDAVLEALPDWHDDGKAKQGVAKINTLLAESGFSNDEIAGVSDARIVRLLNQAALDREKARKYDELKAKSKAANKRVENLPPAIESPGARQTPSNAKAERRRRDVKAWEKAPNLDNLARLF